MRKIFCCDLKKIGIFIGIFEIIFISFEIPFNLILVAPKLTPPNALILFVGIFLHFTIPLGILFSIFFLFFGISFKKKFNLILIHFFMQIFWAFGFTIDITFAILSYEKKGIFFQEFFGMPSPLPEKIKKFVSLNLPEIPKFPNFTIFSSINEKIPEIPNLAKIRYEFEEKLEVAVEKISLISLIIDSLMLILLLFCFIPLTWKLYRQCKMK